MPAVPFPFSTSSFLLFVCNWGFSFYWLNFFRYFLHFSIINLLIIWR